MSEILKYKFDAYERARNILPGLEVLARGYREMYPRLLNVTPEQALLIAQYSTYHTIARTHQLGSVEEVEALTKRGDIELKLRRAFHSDIDQIVPAIIIALDTSDEILKGINDSKEQLANLRK